MPSEIRIEGLNELARELKRIDPALAKELRKTHKTVSDQVVEKGRANIAALPTPQGPKSRPASKGLSARATPNYASVALLRSNPTIYANVLGAATHWAWGRHKLGRGPWQHHLGNTWQTTDLYGLGPAIEEVADRYAVREYADAYVAALKAGAFPDG